MNKRNTLVDFWIYLSGVFIGIFVSILTICFVEFFL